MINKALTTCSDGIAYRTDSKSLIIRPIYKQLIPADGSYFGLFIG